MERDAMGGRQDGRATPWLCAPRLFVKRITLALLGLVILAALVLSGSTRVASAPRSDLAADL